MGRINLFIKGNVDVHDSLHSCRIGGELRWNGVNEILRRSSSDIVARVRHETFTRSDALAAANGVIPQTLDGKDLPLGAYPLQSQFSTKLFEPGHDAIVLSLQPDIATGLYRHRQDGYLFYAAEVESWSRDERAWLKSDFELVPPLSVSAAMDHLSQVITRIQSVNDTPILVYNLSPVIPGDTTYCYLGLDETYATRIRRFNLGLVELSARFGISIVDVDALIARHGAQTLKLDAVHLTPLGYELAAAETVRILSDLGVLDEANQRASGGIQR